MKRHLTGLSLIELLVVTAIVSILAAMLMPALSIVRVAARGLHCQSNLRQIGLAITGYSGDWNGSLPYSIIASPLADPAVFGGYNFATWASPASAGGYLEGNLNANGWSWAAGTKPGGALHCPEAKFLYSPASRILQYGVNTYLCPDINNAADWTLAPPRRFSSFRQTSALLLATDTSEPRWRPGSLSRPTTFATGSNPVVYSTNPALPVDWATANSPDNAPVRWVRRHRAGGANGVFCDGSVRFSTDITAEAQNHSLWVALECVP